MLAVEDRARAKALEVGSTRGTTGPDFIEWMAEVFRKGGQVLYTYGTPESEGDLLPLQTDHGEMLLVYLPDLRKSTVNPDASHVSSKWRTRGRGSKKHSEHITSITHRLPKQKPIPVLPGRRAPSVPMSAERSAEIDRAVSEATAHLRAPKPKAAKPSAKPKTPVSVAKMRTSFEPPESKVTQEAANYKEWKSPQAMESAQPKAAKNTSGSNFSIGDRQFRTHQKTGTVYEKFPGEYWVTVGDPSNPRYGSPVLIREIPGHPGEAVTLTPMKGGTARMVPVTTAKTEDALKEAAERRSERQAARREAAMTKTNYTARQDQEKLAGRQAKTARLAEIVAARLDLYGHKAFGPCDNEDAGDASCKAVAKNSKIPRVHLMTPEQIQASRAEGERPLSANALSLRWHSQVQGANRYVRMLSKHFRGHAVKVANLPSIMSDNPEALSRFIDNERAERATLNIHAAAAIKRSAEKVKTQLAAAEGELARLKKAPPKGTEDEADITCPECAGNGKSIDKKTCPTCQGGGMVTRQQQKAFDAQDKVDDLRTSLDTFNRRREQHEQLAALDTAEMPPLVLSPTNTKLSAKNKRQPAWRTQATAGEGEPEAWLAAKPEIEAALAERKAYWAGQVLYLRNEVADAEFGRKVDAKSQIPPHIQRKEAVKGLRELLKHAQVVDKAFLAAQGALAGDDQSAAMKAVDHAYMQEQRQPESAIAGDRIKGAAPGHRPKFQEMPESKAKLGKIDPAKLAELAKRDTLLENETKRLEALYGPKQPGVHEDEDDMGVRDQRLPATPWYVEPVSDPEQKALLKDFMRDRLPVLISESTVRAYAPVDAEEILGLSGRGKEEEKILADARAEGLFAATHSLALGLTRGAMMDRRITTLLGPAATAHAMRSFIDQNDPARAGEIKAHLTDWVTRNTFPRLESARDMYRNLLVDAREAKAAMQRKMAVYAANPNEPTRGPQASELQYEQREMFERAVTAMRHVSSVYAEVQAVNTMLATLEEKPKDAIPVRVPMHSGFDRKDLTQALQHYGLKPVVDYTIESVNEEPLVHVKYAALAKFVRPHAPLIDPKVAEQLEALQEGDEGSLIRGFVPAGFRSVTHARAEQFEMQHAADVLKTISGPRDIDERVQDAIGTLAMYGLDHREIRSLLHDDRMEENVQAAFRPQYAAAVEKHLPSGDYASDRRAAAKAHTLINRVVDRLRTERGMPKTEADSQRLDEMSAASHLDSALKNVPFGHVAYKNVNELTGIEKDVLRRFWAEEIAGSPYVSEKGEDDPGRKAWSAFVKQTGEGEALMAAQDLLKDELHGQYLYHATSSQVKVTSEGKKPGGISPKVAQVPIRHADKMDRPEFTGPRSGLLNRRSLGAVAEQQMERMLRPKGDLASRYDVRQTPVTALPGRLDMESEKWRHQQMAIRAFPIAKRMAVVTDTGTGKNAIGLGGLTEVMAEGKVKRSVWMVPRKVVENYKLQGDLVRFTHNGSGLRWFAKAGATREERRAAMRDESYNMYITTPESMREDLLDLVDEHFRALDLPTTVPQQRGMADPTTPEAQRQRRDITLRRLSELPEEQRSTIVHAALKKAGIQFQHGFLDEAHRLAERAGKETSQMTLLDIALTDGLPYFMLATASPAQNDMSEAMDLTRKVRPDLFRRGKQVQGAPKQDEHGSPYEWLWENYGSLGVGATREETARQPARDPDPLLVQALRREISPLVFMANADDDNRPNYSEDAVDLTAAQMQQLEMVQRAAGKGYRIDTQEGRDAIRFLNPSAFRKTQKMPDGTSQASEVQKGSTDEYKISANQAQAIETLRREATQHVLHDLPMAQNALTQHLAKQIRTAPKYINKRTGQPASGLVFTNRVEAANQIAKDLNAEAQTKGWKNFKAYPLDFTTSPRDVKTAEDDYRDSVRSGKQVVLVASPAHSEAKDYPEGQWVIHYDLPHTLHAMSQREGRLRAAINKNGDLTATRLVAHYRDKGQQHKHESELASEQVLRGKAPLHRLFRRHRHVAMGDDLTRMFTADRLLRTHA